MVPKLFSFDALLVTGSQVPNLLFTREVPDLGLGVRRKPSLNQELLPCLCKIFFGPVWARQKYEQTSRCRLVKWISGNPIRAEVTTRKK